MLTKFSKYIVRPTKTIEMEKLSGIEKIGIGLMILAVATLILKHGFGIDENVTNYGRYLAGIGAGIWGYGWFIRRKTQKETEK